MVVAPFGNCAGSECNTRSEGGAGLQRYTRPGGASDGDSAGYANYTILNLTDDAVDFTFPMLSRLSPTAVLRISMINLEGDKRQSDKLGADDLEPDIAVLETVLTQPMIYDRAAAYNSGISFVTDETGTVAITQSPVFFQSYARLPPS